MNFKKNQEIVVIVIIEYLTAIKLYFILLFYVIKRIATNIVRDLIKILYLVIVHYYIYVDKL